MKSDFFTYGYSTQQGIRETKVSEQAIWIDDDLLWINKKHNYYVFDYLKLNFWVLHS